MELRVIDILTVVEVSSLWDDLAIPCILYLLKVNSSYAMKFLY
jgi:hypothetical protein